MAWIGLPTAGPMVAVTFLRVIVVVLLLWAGATGADYVSINQSNLYSSNIPA